jgi:hypothetical protein
MNLVERNRKLLNAIIKGDISVSDLVSNGGYLNPMQADRFVERIYDARPSLISEVRRVDMTGPKMEINKIGISGNFLHKAPGETTALASSQRTAATTGKITLTTEELLGVMYIPYRVLEDNISRGRLEDTLMDDLIPKKINRDLNKLIIQGDTGSADTLLQSFHGVHKLATDHVVAFNSTQGNVVSKGSLVWSNILKAMPYQYREVDEDLRYWVHPLINDAYSDWMSARATNAGDAQLYASHLKEMNFRGIPIRREPYQVQTKGFLTHPQNLVLGIQREIQFETDRDIETRMIIVVVTLRVAFAVEETDAVVTVTGLVTNEWTTTTTTT